jgi:hypothetical protein
VPATAIEAPVDVFAGGAFRLVSISAGVTKMNWSPFDVTDVPAEFATLTSTTPGDCAGDVAVSDVDELTEND